MSRLSTRLLITYLALGLLGIGGLVLWTGQRLQADIVERAVHEQEIQAQILTNALLSGLEEREDEEPAGQRPLQRLVEVYARSSSSRVTVFDEGLDMEASSDPAVALHVESDFPEFQAARQGTSQHDIRWDPWRGEERAFVAAPVLGEHGDLLGYVQLSVSTAPIQAEIRRMWIGLLTAGAVVLLVMALASILLARGIARPIQDLTSVTEAFARGELDQRVSPAGPDEVQRLGRAFNQMSRQLSDLITRQTEFAANASHELRSPLAGLQLRLDVLQKQGAVDPELTRRYLMQMEREVAYLQRVSEQLLALAAVDQAGASHGTATDLAPLIYEVVDDMSPLAHQAGLNLYIVTPPHLPHTVVHAEQIRMILRNLLDNAIKYTPAGGQVMVEADSVEDAVEIQVTDTGLGIPAEALPHVFDRFYRVDKARERSQGGSGLGLALAHSLTEANGGTIKVASQPGVGTTFTLRFPPMRPASAPA